MLKELIKLYGKEKLNTLTKYPSILTLHKLGEKGRLLDGLTTPISSKDKMNASEKIDGTNVRILIYGDEHVFGSREFLLSHSDDLFFDPAQGIVEAMRDFSFNLPKTDKLTVMYGELYGGKVSSNSKWYGTDKLGFRLFDVVEFDNLDVLNLLLSHISSWREKETENGIVYGQNFLPTDEITKRFPQFEMVPSVPFELGDMTHETILSNLQKFIPATNVAHSENALKRAEGVVIRNADRSKIVKLRFEDYERTLKAKKQLC
jgi:hypothetical protein